MRGIYTFVVKPKGERYNNKKKVGEKELILNTEVYNHQYVNREAIVISTPIAGHTEIKAGDTVLVHHNVFRRWHDVKGIEKNSRSYFDENNYINAMVSPLLNIVNYEVLSQNILITSTHRHPFVVAYLIDHFHCKFILLIHHLQKIVDY